MTTTGPAIPLIPLFLAATSALCEDTDRGGLSVRKVDSFYFVSIKGDAETRGRLLGTALREHIRRLCADGQRFVQAEAGRYAEFLKGQNAAWAIRAAAWAALAPLEPQLTADERCELQAVAKAAGVADMDLFTVNASVELMEAANSMRKHQCSTVMAAGPGADVWFAHNTDTPMSLPESPGENLLDHSKVVILVEPDDGFRYLSITNAGIVGTLFAMNEHGLCFAYNSSGRGFRPKGIPIRFLLRRVLTTCATAKQAREKLTSMSSPVNGLLFLADAAGQGLSLHWTGHGCQIRPFPQVYPRRYVHQATKDVFAWSGRFDAAPFLAMCERARPSADALVRTLRTCWFDGARLRGLCNDSTIYSAVFHPRERAAWIATDRTPTALGGFVRIDLWTAFEDGLPEELPVAIPQHPLLADRPFAYRSAVQRAAARQSNGDAEGAIGVLEEIRSGSSALPASPLADAIEAIRRGEAADAWLRLLRKGWKLSPMLGNPGMEWGKRTEWPRRRHTPWPSPHIRALKGPMAWQLQLLSRTQWRPRREYHYGNLDHDSPKAGHSCWRFVPPTDGNVLLLFQKIDVKPGETVCCSAWLRTSIEVLDPHGTFPSITLRAQGSGRTDLAQTKRSAKQPLFRWARLTVEFTAPPATDAVFLCILPGTRMTEAWVDEVAVVGIWR